MTELESLIRQEILSVGSISFARFMEHALYCPEFGYYERVPKVVGKRGDFYTSVSVGPLFGELLARQFAVWLEAMAPEPLTVVEAGAHDGQLAGDILQWFRRSKPELPIQYVIIEPSRRRRGWQREKLAVFAGQVSWFARLEELAEPVCGVIFSNELLDAMPAHILEWREGRWMELRVTVGGERFVWQSVSLDADLGQPTLPPALAAVLPEGFRVEVCPAAQRWWRQAAGRLASGKLMTIDYGLEEDEFLAPQRSGGTVRAYYHQHLTDDLLANPGEQDITAHVNFTRLIAAGEEAGLQTEGLVSQSKFLTAISGTLTDWTADRVRQFQTLTHPEHMGRSFRVLVQSRAATPARGG